MATPGGAAPVLRLADSGPKVRRTTMSHRLRNLIIRIIAKCRHEGARRLSSSHLAALQRLSSLPFRENLAFLAAIYGTDKGVYGHNNVLHYQAHLSSVRRSTQRVLEIGVLHGGSLAMWRDFFPNAEVIGLDIEEKKVSGPRLALLQGDQSSPKVLAELASLGPFDLIVDDGSHLGSHVRASFGALFTTLRPGGWYVIEDLATAYSVEYQGGELGYPGTSVVLVKSLVDAVLRAHVAENVPLPAVASLHVYDQIAFIRRDPN